MKTTSDSIAATYRARRPRAAVAGTDEMIGLVFHDMRNPLAAARGYLSLMRLEPAAVTPQDLAAAEDCIDAALALMEEVTDLGKLQRGQFPMARRIADVAEVVGDIGNRLRPMADRAGKELDVDGGGGNTTVLASGDLLERVVAEVLTGTLRYASSKVAVSVDPRPERDCVEVRIWDDGHPVAPEMLEALFDAGAQVDLRDAASRRGMGLSLPFARAALAAMGGSIQAEPVETGMAVVMTLPALLAYQGRSGRRSGVGCGAQCAPSKSAVTSCA